MYLIFLHPPHFSKKANLNDKKLHIRLGEKIEATNFDALVCFLHLHLNQQIFIFYAQWTELFAYLCFG